MKALKFNLNIILLLENLLKLFVVLKLQEKH